MRPGWLVHAEQEARDAAERAGLNLDYLPDRDEAPTPAPAREDALMERIRAGAARMEADRARMRASRSELTEAEARAVIARLEAKP